MTSVGRGGDGPTYTQGRWEGEEEMIGRDRPGWYHSIQPREGTMDRNVPRDSVQCRNQIAEGPIGCLLSYPSLFVGLQSNPASMILYLFFLICFPRQLLFTSVTMFIQRSPNVGLPSAGSTQPESPFPKAQSAFENAGKRCLGWRSRLLLLAFDRLAVSSSFVKRPPPPPPYVVPPSKRRRPQSAGGKHLD